MRIITLFFCLNLAFAAVALAEESETGWLTKGTWQFGIWSGGGAAVTAPTKDTQMFVTGFRAAKALTDRLQYAIEVVPAFVVFQENSTVYGADITPFLLKWNFAGTDKKVFPYALGGAGTLFTVSDVPEGTSHFNFTPQAGFGIQLSTSAKRSLGFEVRYVHISNGGFEEPNPGIDSIQFHIGYQWVP